MDGARPAHRTRMHHASTKPHSHQTKSLAFTSSHQTQVLRFLRSLLTLAGWGAESQAAAESDPRRAAAFEEAGPSASATAPRLVVVVYPACSCGGGRRVPLHSTGGPR